MATHARAPLYRMPAILLIMMLLAASCGEITAPEAVVSEPAATPIARGVWRELPEAPIGTRLYAVSGWSGSEALFWAGSNVLRSFANTRGVGYDPRSDSWRELAVPGWGHPGLTGSVFDGQFYVAAKGGASRVDPSDGSDADLPHAPGFLLSTLVATDKAIWALGPVNSPENGAVRVGIARYQPEDDTWIPGPVFDGAQEMGDLFQDLLFLEQPVLWTGSNIIVWNHDGHGLAFDPVAQTWETMPALVAPQGTLADSEVAVADTDLVALVSIQDKDDVRYAVANWDGEQWTWRYTEIEAIDFDTVTIAAVRDWIVIFSPDHPPSTIHLPTGASIQHLDAPIAGVQAPNIVWTGHELIIWGGAPTRSEDNPNPPGGAVWTPPAD